MYKWIKSKDEKFSGGCWRDRGGLCWYGEEQMAAASERKTPLINEYLVTNFSNPSLPRGALMDTARISQASQQEIAKKICPLQ